jgi:hypothetical protein
MRHHPKAHRDRFFAAPAAQNDSSIPRADRRHPEVCQQHHEYDDRNIRPIAHWYGEKCGLGAMREVHSAPSAFSRLGEFPAEEPNDLPLTPTAEAFYRARPTVWQRYMSFWLASLLNRIVFFVIPFVVMLIPVIGVAPRFYRWLYVRRIDQAHRALGKLERHLAQSADRSRLGEYRARIAEIDSAVHLLKVPRPFEVDLQRLRIHLRMVQEDVSRMAADIDAPPIRKAAHADEAEHTRSWNGTR